MAPGGETGEVPKAEGSGYAAPLRRGGGPKGQVSQELEATPEDNGQTTSYMTRVSRGDRQACGALQQHYVLRVASFFRRRHRCDQTVEDLTQGVFCRVWEKREKYRSGVSDCAWLLGFARFVLKEHRAKPYPKQKTDSDHALDYIVDVRQASPCHQAELKEQTQILRTLMGDLPEKQRWALELAYLEGLSSREASEILACSVVTIRRNRHIAVANTSGLAEGRGMILALSRYDRQERWEVNSASSWKSYSLKAPLLYGSLAFGSEKLTILTRFPFSIDRFARFSQLPVEQPKLAYGP